MVENRSTATARAAFRSRFEDDSDPLDWIGIQIASINREISSVRHLLQEMGDRPRAPRESLLKQMVFSIWRTIK